MLLSEENKFLNIDPHWIKDVFSATADIIWSHTKATLNVMHKKKNWITEYLKMTKDKSSGELEIFRALYFFFLFYITICLAVDSVPKCYITEGNFKE